MPCESNNCLSLHGAVQPSRNEREEIWRTKQNTYRASRRRLGEAPLLEALLRDDVQLVSWSTACLPVAVTVLCSWLVPLSDASSPWPARQRDVVRVAQQHDPPRCSNQQPLVRSSTLRAASCRCKPVTSVGTQRKKDGPSDPSPAIPSRATRPPHSACKTSRP